MDNEQWFYDLYETDEIENKIFDLKLSKQERRYKFIKFCFHLTCTILLINIMLLGTYLWSYWGGI